MAQGTKDAWGSTVILGKVIGRDNVVIPPQQVEDLAQIGCTNKEIANFFGVTENSLGRNFVTELQKGRELLKQKLRRAMLQNACVHMNAALQIFLAKNFLGMSDQGQQGEENRVLPWTDTEDEEVSADDTELLEDNTETE